jgi:hypothetical protein
MAGQSTWNNAGTATNAYPVRFRLQKQLYWDSTYKCLFGKVNGGRVIDEPKAIHGGNTLVITEGNDSPIWTKNLSDGGNEVRFTLAEENTGLPTYGEADVKDGAFGQYKHTAVWTRTVRSPGFPVVGNESEELIKEQIDDVVAHEKTKIVRWQAVEMDLDAFRAIFMSASRGLLKTDEGGLSYTPPFGTAGTQRSCYNNHVYADSYRGSLVTASAVATTHETNLATALDALQDETDNAFTWACHKTNSNMLDDLGISIGVKVGGKEYRSVAIIDPRNIDRLVADSTLLTVMQNALDRGKDNPAINMTKAFVLDDILYIPAYQLKFFRPTVSGGAITYGIGNTSDPRLASYSNTSNICPTIYMGPGALLRGTRAKTWWADKIGDFKVGAKYNINYTDGWIRKEWMTRDSRTELKNNSMLICWNYDPGVGVSYAGS